MFSNKSNNSEMVKYFFWHVITTEFITELLIFARCRIISAIKLYYATFPPLFSVIVTRTKQMQVIIVYLVSLYFLF